MNRILIAAISLSLASCASTKLTPPPVPPEYRKPCVIPADLENGKHGSVEAKLIETTAELGRCAAKHDALNRAIDARDALFK